jgi:serine/threonine protein phosphatase PrpC
MALPSGVGASADIGRRSHMEDRWAVQATPGGLFAAVYDGHGGSHVADRAAADLHLAVLRALRAGLGATDALRQAFDELEAATADPDCGSTVAALLLGREELVTAHVGDSRVVRVGKAGSEGLTRDHRIDVADERARVLRMGAELDPPYVVRGDRGLMMTRSLGDRWFRPVGVIPEPEVGRHALGTDDVALVAATDGVWDVLSVEDAARVVRRAATAQAGADALIAAALAAGAHDNVTALVVRLADLDRAASRGEPSDDPREVVRDTRLPHRSANS